MAYLVQNVVTKFIFLSLFFSLSTSVLSLPFVVFHGINATCKTVENFTQTLEEYSGNHGQCIVLGEQPGDSIFIPMMDQVTLACQKIKEMDELKNGYNLIGISQGALVSRGLIEFCDEAPPVKNFISVGGPQAGIIRAFNCTGIFCQIIINIEDHFPIYNVFQQDFAAPFNYIKRPLEIDEYMKWSKFLPYVNNEIRRAQNSIYKERFTSLSKLVLFMFEDDTVILPKESSWFGYYPEWSTDKILPFNETLQYKLDWIGLRTLHDAGKVIFKMAPGDHCTFSDTLYEMITPFLKDDEEDLINQIAVA